MQLPFTVEQFFDLFAAYNEALWPALVGLWIASLAVVLQLISSNPPTGRRISALLAVHWAWSAVAYHAAFFTRINPAAWLFAAAFLVQAALFIWVGVVRGRLSFAVSPGARTRVAWALIAYSLAYPAINAAQHLTLWRIPAFGVPCPTTIFTAGMLMLLSQRPRLLAVIPVIWSLVGGSAALLLNVPADYVLPITGIALALSSLHGLERPAIQPG